MIIQSREHSRQDSQVVLFKGGGGGVNNMEYYQV